MISVISVVMNISRGLLTFVIQHKSIFFQCFHGDRLDI